MHNQKPMPYSPRRLLSTSLIAASLGVTVTRIDGSAFLANPLNIAVESELYTRFLDDDSKDTQIEEWFAETIDGPASRLIEHLLDPANVTRRSFRGLPEKERLVKAVGFRVNPYVDWISIPAEIRRAISEYVSALLVRHPRYLAKLTAFHLDNSSSDKEAKGKALNNMLELYNVYRKQMSTSVFIITRRVGASPTHMAAVSGAGLDARCD